MVQERFRVLVAGCGYVGGALAGRLAAEGHAVWGLRRRADRLPPGVRPFPADLGEPGSLAALPPALDRVVYSVSPDGRSDAAYHAAYVAGLRNLLEALHRQEQRPARLVLTSTTAVYGHHAGDRVDESTPPEPADFRGARALEGEQVAHDGGIPATVIRLAGIYGPGRTRLVERVRAGDASCAEGAWTNRIHRDDCAGALRHLLLIDDPAPVYLGVDAEPAPQCEVMRWLAARLGAALPTPGIGRGGRGSKRCSNRLLVASGYRFRFPSFREGYEALLAGTAPGDAAPPPAV